MDDTPSPTSSSTNGSTPRNGPPVGRKIQQRYAAEEDEGIDDEAIKCSGKSCKACGAGVIADCVAVCCCPCAVVNILAFTFLKIPYLMGRRWLAKGRMKLKKRKNRKERTSTDEMSERGVAVMGGRIGSSRESSVESEEVELENEVVELRNYNFSAEEEDVWMELYKIGHLGFGRVSFSTSGSSSHRNITSM